MGLEKKKVKKKGEVFFKNPPKMKLLQVVGESKVNWMNCSPSKTGMVQSLLWFTQALTH
jgi:hypothetical protein